MATVKVDPFIIRGGKRVLPSFSMAEHDRRYGRVRRLMAEMNLDALLAPPADGHEPQASSRYLTQVGGQQGAAWAVVPAEGPETAILSSEREHRMWRTNLVWPEDLRWGRQTELVIDRIKELELDRSRIGVVGLAQTYQRPEGLMVHATWEKIRKELPQATFVPATEVVDKARVVKGEEEIAVIQRIVDANEAAIARMAEIARPGMEEGELWIEMARVMIEMTAEYPSRLSLGSNNQPANSSNSMGLPVAMEDGGILSQEIDAKVQGYRAQSNHAILIGNKNREKYVDAMEGAIATYEHLLAWLRPGRTVGEFLEEFVRFAESRDGRGFGVIIHTNGAGSDRPRVGPGNFATDKDWVIEEGWTFTIKPHVHSHRSETSASVGDPLTITASGARRLGRRKLEPIVTG